MERPETHGIVSFRWDQCTLQAGLDTLTLRAEAVDEVNLQRVWDLVAGHPPGREDASQPPADGEHQQHG